jgi:hypothetical protein
MRRDRNVTPPFKVSCHCGDIQLEVSAELGEVVECNCSICVRSGFLHWYVAPDQVQLKTQGRLLHTYFWRSATGGQHFCPTCGVAIIRTSTQHPPPVSINARCIEDIDIAALKIRPFDGKHLYP